MVAMPSPPLRWPRNALAANERQFERFRDVWRFDQSECRHVLLTKDIQGMPISIPLLCLPNSFDPSPRLIEDFCPVRMWKSIGGVCIDIPYSAIAKPFEFSLEDNMAASTLVAIAQHRHLDSLNRRK